MGTLTGNMLADDYLADVCDGKTGLELFRELTRLYSEANVEDYYKMGKWNNRTLRIDWCLLDAHRKEAGAPMPPPLEDVPVPKLPENKFAGPALLTPALLQLVQTRAALSKGPAAELRDAAIFISKNKLDPTRSKGLLMDLPLQERRQVMETFKSEQVGFEATDDLEAFINEKKESGSLTGITKVLPLVAAPKVAAVNGVRPSLTTSPSGLRAEELRALALFIARNKLDPTQAKAMLLKLGPERRKEVMEGFSASVATVDSTDELKNYIDGVEEDPSEEPASKKIKV